MENNDWYQKYQEYQRRSVPQPEQQSEPEQRQRPKQKKKVSVTALICCVLAAALIAGGVGAFVMNLALSGKNQTAAAQIDSEIRTGQSVPVQSAPEKEAGKTTVNYSVSTAPSSGYSRAQIVEVAAPSVVGVDVTFKVSSGYNLNPWIYFGGGGFGGNYGQGQQEAQGAGSGVVISSDGYIVTCYHVVEDATSIKVTLNDDSVYDATVVGTDERNDLAIIKIDAANLVPATLGDSDMLTVGEDVVAIGNHLGELRGTATGGMISALNRELNVEGSEMHLLQHDAAISPGSSGGGLFNSSGSLIGIVNAKASDSEAEGLGFAIPVNDVKQIIDDIINYGYVKGRAYLGVYTQNVSLQSDRSGWGSYFGGGETSCVQVAQVIEGYAAEKAGIQPNDLILKIGDVSITSNDILSATIGSYNAGDTAEITIQRNGQEMTVNVTFSEYAPDSQKN